jgi:hypothetical protein
MEMTESIYYRIWFKDGSRVWFREEEMSAHAERFGFDSAELLEKGDIVLTDESGGEVGGVMLDGAL